MAGANNTPPPSIENTESMSEEDNVLPAPKKRGRPKGSLGKKKLAESKEKAHVLDVSFDSEEILPRDVEPPEPVEILEPPTPRIRRRPRKPRNIDPPTDVGEDQFQEPVQPVQPMSCMEVLQRGIALAKATEKQRKIDLYDSYFRIR